ncbi:MAG: hypothetical protein IJH91_00450 [Mogibacterium sp.]|nr:hypothetical protein [Mogibacterium sp.]
MGLFTPAWMTDDILKEDKAIKSVAKMSRQDELLEVALHAPRVAVRLAAVERLTDQNALFSLTKDSDWKVSHKAIDMITNQTLLEKLAAERPTPEIVGRLTSQSLLEKYALEENWQEPYPGADELMNRNTEVQCAAIRNLNSRDVLEKLCFGSTDNRVRLAAAEKLGRTDIINEVRFILQVENLKNAPKGTQYKIARREIEAISDKSILVDLYLHARNLEIRELAQERWLKLQPTQQELVQLLLENHISTYDKQKYIPMIRKAGLIELLQKIDVRSDDDERTVLLALDRLKSFRDELLEFYSDPGANAFLREQAWTLLVKHHRKYLAEQGLKEDADRTAAELRASDEAWRKHLNDVSDAMERYGGNI